MGPGRRRSRRKGAETVRGVSSGRRPSGMRERGREGVGPKRNFVYCIQMPGARRRRVLPLPAPVQTDKARARFQDGVLEIRITKTEEARKKSRKVAIEKEETP